MTQENPPNQHRPTSPPVLPAISFENPVDAFRRDNFFSVPCSVSLPFLGGVCAEEPIDPAALQATWNSMQTDTYMADGGIYRQRTFATLATSGKGDPFALTGPTPHYQDVKHNDFAGGIPRWLQQTPDSVTGSGFFRSLMATAKAFGDTLSGPGPWWAEFHQFRILTGTGKDGQPTPEGLHRDGVDYVLIMLINRVNVRGGKTTITDPSGTVLTTMTLRNPFDCIILKDDAVRHAVSTISPVDPLRPGFRDTIVLTLTRK